MDNKDELYNAALEDAAKCIKKRTDGEERMRTISICMTVILVVSIICGAVIAAVAIHSQQQTIQQQSASLNDLLYGAEIVTETADADDGGTAIVGDDNTFVGGDLNGESK